MVTQKKLCLVEDTLYVTGRGLIIMTTQWQTGQVTAGDWIELRSAEGHSHIARIKSIEMVRFTPGSERMVDVTHMGGLLLPNVTCDDVKRGDEVWSFAKPPQEACLIHQQQASTVASKSWWQRLFRRNSA